MSIIRSFTVAVALLTSAAALGSTQDFAFLVAQRVAAMECPGYEVDIFAVNDAIFQEGGRLGWSRHQTIREMEERRLYQVEQHQSDPAAYCALARELEEASQQRLRSLTSAP